MIKIINVIKNDNDAKLILEWRNDKITREMSFNSNIQAWDDFQKKFYNSYFSNYINPVFASINDDKIAFIGFTRNSENDKNFNIGINISPKFRNRKLGLIILNNVLLFIKKNYPNVNKIIAEIKENNIPSLKIFEKANFEYINTRIFKNTNIRIYNFEMNKIKMYINNSIIGKNYPTYIIAELSCNHNQDKSIAFQLIDQAHKAGANAIKLQTYTADTMTIKSDKSYFTDCLKDTIWEGKTLHDLYSVAYTPWEWHKELKKYANNLGMDLFSSPFDSSAVDFLEELDMPAYKIASFEIVDHVLIKKIAQTRKPVIISSGMASKVELEEAINLLRENGCSQICMLKCTSAYPAKPDDANLVTIKNMMESYDVIGGLSDHTLGIEVPIAAVCLGARIIEKHFTLSRESGSPDDEFSLTPDEFKQMVDSIRIVEKTLGKVTYGGVKKESSSKKFRKSLFVVKDIKKGELFTTKNLRPIRPGYGLHTKHYEEVLGKECKMNVDAGEPLKWNMF